MSHILITLEASVLYGSFQKDTGYCFLKHPLSCQTRQTRFLMMFMVYLVCGICRTCSS